MLEGLKKSQSARNIFVNQIAEETKGQIIPEFDAEKEALKYRPIRFFPNLNMGFSIKDLKRDNEFIKNNRNLQKLLKSCLKPIKLPKTAAFNRSNSSGNLNFDTLPPIRIRNRFFGDTNKNNDSFIKGLKNNTFKNSEEFKQTKLKKSSSAAFFGNKKSKELEKGRRTITIISALSKSTPAQRDVNQVSNTLRSYYVNGLMAQNLLAKTTPKDEAVKLLQDKMNADKCFIKVNYESRILGDITIFGIIDGEGEYGNIVAKVVKNYILKYLKNTVFPSTLNRDNYYTILTTLFEECNKFLKNRSFIPEDYEKVDKEIKEEIQREKEKNEKEEELRRELEQLEKEDKMRREKEKQEKEREEKLHREKVLKERMKREQYVRLKKQIKAADPENAEILKQKLVELEEEMKKDAEAAALAKANEEKKEEEKELTEEEKEKKLYDERLRLSRLQMKNELKQNLMLEQLKKREEQKKEESEKDGNVTIQKMKDLPDFPTPSMNCYDSGASCTLLMIPNDKKPNKIYCASIGTCRCVLFTADKSFCITYDHNSYSTSEIKRIENTNKGEVRKSEFCRGENNSEGYPEINTPPNIFFPYRDHKKGLNLTRCFGYFFYERMAINAEAEVVEKDLLKSNIKFLVAGTNGFWKYADEDDEIRKICFKYYVKNNCFQACKDLETMARKKKQAVKKGSREDEDDITVMVIFFGVEIRKNVIFQKRYSVLIVA
ncbi:MAG: protein phosphatase 2C domain-containing protein, partial [archaeon]|nr:protein phosphatase 2C domain-containing protein [archaeon]